MNSTLTNNTPQNSSKIIQDFIEAISNNDLGRIKELEKKDNIKKHLTQTQFHKSLVSICYDNKFNILEHILQSRHFKKYINTPNSILTKLTLLRIACKEGHLEIVSLLMKGPKFKIYYEMEELNDCFRLACKRGHVDTANYLLTSSDLDVNVSVDADCYSGLITACEEGKLEIVNFLLNSPNIIPIEIEKLDSQVISEIFKYGNIEVIKYFIFEMNVGITILDKVYNNISRKEELQLLFDLRELNNKLDNNLKKENTFKHKMKI